MMQRSLNILDIQNFVSLLKSNGTYFVVIDLIELSFLTLFFVISFLSTTRSEFKKISSLHWIFEHIQMIAKSKILHFRWMQI